jgi:hypothetical protein
MVELDFPEEIKIYENQVSKRIPNNKKVNNHLSLIVEVTILLGCIIMSFNSNVYGTRILLLFFSFLLLLEIIYKSKSHAKVINGVLFYTSSLLDNTIKTINLKVLKYLAIVDTNNGTYIIYNDFNHTMSTLIWNESFLYKIIPTIAKYVDTYSNMSGIGEHLNTNPYIPTNAKRKDKYITHKYVKLIYIIALLITSIIVSITYIDLQLIMIIIAIILSALISYIIINNKCRNIYIDNNNLIVVNLITKNIINIDSCKYISIYEYTHYDRLSPYGAPSWQINYKDKNNNYYLINLYKAGQKKQRTELLNQIAIRTKLYYSIKKGIQ